MSPPKRALLSVLPHGLRQQLIVLAKRASTTLDLTVQALLGRFDAPAAIAPDVLALREQIGDGLTALAAWEWTCPGCGQDAALAEITTCSKHEASTCVTCSPVGCPRCIEDAATMRQAEEKAARRLAAEEARTEGWAKPGAPTKLPKPAAVGAPDEVAAP